MGQARKAIEYGMSVFKRMKKNNGVKILKKNKPELKNNQRTGKHLFFQQVFGGLFWLNSKITAKVLWLGEVVVFSIFIGQKHNSLT